MVQKITTNVKAVTTLLIVVGCLSVASDVQGAETRIYPSIDTAGYVAHDDSICTESTIGGFRTYAGQYPATTTLVSNNSNDLLCDSVFNGTPTYSIEDGYINGAGTTEDGDYWVLIANTGLNNPSYPSQWTETYWFKASRQEGQWFFEVSTTTESTECTTCTRLLSTSPADGSFVATSTQRLITTSLYIAQEDYDEDYTYTLKYYYYPQATYSEANIIGSALAPFAEQSETVITGYGTTTTAFFASKLNITGIYNYEITLTRTKDGIIYDILDRFIDFGTQYFYETGQYTVGTTSDYEALKNAVNLGERIAGRLQSCNFFDFTNLSLTATSSAVGCITALLVPTKDDLVQVGTTMREGILAKAPFGYALRIYDLFFASSTVIAVPSITISFPTGSPGEGQSLTLEVPNNVNNSITYLDEATVPTIDGSPYQSFLYYWETLWYIVFAFWAMAEIIGTMRVVTAVEMGDAKYKNRSEATRQTKSMSTRKGSMRYTTHKSTRL